MRISTNIFKELRYEKFVRESFHHIIYLFIVTSALSANVLRDEWQILWLREML